jgi:hypothetical protein
MANLDEQLIARKEQARTDSDLEEFVFYSEVQRELELLRLAVRFAARLYHNTGDDGAWNALYEALSDTGLLDREEQTT